jgi:hypothetical protein
VIPPRTTPIEQQRTATCLETDEDVMQALRANFGPSPSAPVQPLISPAPLPLLAPAPATPSRPPAPLVPGAPIPLGSQPTGPVAVVGNPGMNELVNRRSTAKLYCPIVRPPMAVLTAFDDGKVDGEQFRLRGGRFVIGRTEGQLKLSHDNQVSSKHVEIFQKDVGGRPCWVIVDLKSTNGLYVRVARTVLVDKSEFFIGQGYYRLTYPTSGTSTTADYMPARSQRNATQAFGGEQPAGMPTPTLVELLRGAVHSQFALSRPEYWIGTDPECSVGRPNDPYCEPRHAKLFRDAQGMWHVENNMSVNGVWLRVPEIVVEGTVQFQIGEQRFKLQVGA